MSTSETAAVIEPRHRQSDGRLRTGDAVILNISLHEIYGGDLNAVGDDSAFLGRVKTIRGKRAYIVYKNGVHWHQRTDMFIVPKRTKSD